MLFLFLSLYIQNIKNKKKAIIQNWPGLFDVVEGGGGVERVSDTVTNFLSNIVKKKRRKRQILSD